MNILFTIALLFIGTIGMAQGMNRSHVLTQAQRDDLHHRQNMAAITMWLGYVALADANSQAHPQIPHSLLPYIPYGCGNFKKDARESNRY